MFVLVLVLGGMVAWGVIVDLAGDWEDSWLRDFGLIWLGGMALVLTGAVLTQRPPDIDPIPTCACPEGASAEEKKQQ